MRTFEVINRSLRRNGRTYAVGSPLRLDEDNAAVLLERQRVQLKPAETKVLAARAARKTTARKSAAKR
jgi:hypothetical protein